MMTCCAVSHGLSISAVLGRMWQSPGLTTLARPSQTYAYLDDHVGIVHRRSLKIFLELLRWRLGALLFCGRHCLDGWLMLPQPFTRLSRARREAIVRHWLATGPSLATMVRAGARAGFGVC